MVDLLQEMKLLVLVAILCLHPILFQSFLTRSLCPKSFHQWVQEAHYGQIVFQIQQALINPWLELVLTEYVVGVMKLRTLTFVAIIQSSKFVMAFELQLMMCFDNECA
jgi:hypothetical protein